MNFWNEYGKKIAFIVFTVVFVFQSNPVFAEDLPICSDSQIQDPDTGQLVIDPTLATECQVPKKGIQVAVYLPGLHKATYYPVEIHAQTVIADTGQKETQFCRYQSEKACYYTYGVHEYVALLYTYLVGVIGIVSVGMIVYASIRWVTAYGNATTIQEAKDRIIGAIMGLAVALLSFVLLATVNPQIVQVTDLIVPPVPPVPVPAAQNECAEDGQLQPIVFDNKTLIKGNVSDPRLLPDALSKLKKAAEIASNPPVYGFDTFQPMAITVGSAHRSLQKQQELWDCYEKSKSLPPGQCAPGCASCSEAAKPTCQAPHIQGIAVDICTGSTCGYLNKTYAVPTSAPADIQEQMRKLQLVFQKAGFSRYCKEWWHFESSPRSCACAPGEYRSCNN